jgi:hypothetical protein
MVGCLCWKQAKENLTAVAEAVKEEFNPTANATERSGHSQAASEKLQSAKESAHEGKEDLKDAASDAADAAGHGGRQVQVAH